VYIYIYIYFLASFIECECVVVFFLCDEMKRKEKEISLSSSTLLGFFRLQLIIIDIIQRQAEQRSKHARSWAISRAKQKNSAWRKTTQWSSISRMLCL